MLHQEFEPPEQLRDTIKCFWYNRRDFGELESSFEVMPDGFAEIIFHFGSACSILIDGELRPLVSPFVMGLLNRPAILSSKNRFEVIGVRCYPWTVFDLLDLPSGKCGVRLTAHPVAQLHATLSTSIDAGNIDAAITEVARYFLMTRSGISIDRTSSKAGLAMRDANGSMPISQVAAVAHATVRTLERKFKRSSGFSVKDVSGLMRFEQVRNRLWLQPKASIADLAHELGYTDQSHLSREFKRYSGTTPAAFARKANQEHLAMSTNFGAFIQA